MKPKKDQPKQRVNRKQEKRHSPNVGRDKLAKPEKDKAREPDSRSEFYETQKVSLLITARTRLGFVANINGTRHKGLLYKNEVFHPLKIGQEIDGFIKKIRDDKTIDLCLQKPGYRAVNTLSQKILDHLEQQGGFSGLTDKSSPEVISKLFGVSKRSFKKAVGNLYKKRMIVLEKDGIRLKEKSHGPRKKKKP